MGFSFYFGFLEPNNDDEQEHVFNMKNFNNVFSISYSSSYDFFNSSTNHTKCFHLMRVGDVDGADSVIVQVSPILEDLIMELDEKIERTIEFKQAFKNGQKLCNKKKRTFFIQSE